MKIFFTLILTFLLATIVFAKDMKIASVDIEKVFTTINMKKDADATIDAKNKKLDQDLVDKTIKLVAITDSIELEKEKENISKFEQEQRVIIEHEKLDFANNIYGAIYDKIKDVAKKFNYDIIFNKKDLLYTHKDIDLTMFVIEEMNKN